jgi:hypothetical protein
LTKIITNLNENHLSSEKDFGKKLKDLKDENEELQEKNTAIEKELDIMKFEHS